MSKFYYCLHTYPGQKAVHVMRGADDKVIVAEGEESKQLLVEIAERLVQQNLISNYRIIQEI